MKRSILLPILVLVLASMACSTSGVSEIGKQELVTPTAAPTNTPIPENTTEKSYYDDFSSSNPGWSDMEVVTTQAMPGQMKSAVKQADGLMVFDFRDTETYAYKFYKNPAEADVAIEAKAQAGGQLQNGIALVCRAKNDYSAWYEARVSSLSQYALYRFDRKLRDDGKNPYIQLHNGNLRIDVFGPTKENVLRFTCQGGTLKLEINNQVVATVDDGNLSEGGLVGVGAMSGTILPVNIRFDYFSYGQP